MQAATRIRREVKDLDNAISGRAVDALLNVEAVKLGAAEALETQAYDKSLTAYQRASVRLEVASAALNAGQALLLAGGMTAAMIAAATMPGVTAGDLVMVQGLLLQLWAPLQFLGWFYRELRQSLVDMEDLFKLLRTQTAVPDGTKDLPTPPPAVSHGGTHHLGSTTHSNGNGDGKLAGVASPAPPQQGLRVVLQDVKFSYPGIDREVLKGVTITAEPGQSIAVVGPSGSGKSTLLRLLVRLFDVSSGVVTLDGVDVRELKPSALRNAVAVVPQDTVLFNDTVLHNVAYGKPGATPEAVRAAAASAKLDAAIARMPQGWATMVGERGLKLSGGEKQRVAIARAFLREPRLLICDEATSALDTGTERGIMASLQELATGRTSVFVAHRLSTVQGCDRIFVLKEGKVAEEGTHAQLMARPDGIYKEMWEMQAAQDALKEQMHEEEPSPSDEEMTWRAEARDEEEDQDDVWRETEDSSGEESATEGPLEVEAAAVERTL